MQQKKLWRNPQIIILGRSTPEEAVLDGCKFRNSTPRTGPGLNNNNRNANCRVNGVPCNARRAS